MARLDVSVAPPAQYAPPAGSGSAPGLEASLTLDAAELGRLLVHVRKRLAVALATRTPAPTPSTSSTAGAQALTAGGAPTGSSHSRGATPSGTAGSTPVPAANSAQDMPASSPSMQSPSPTPAQVPERKAPERKAPKAKPPARQQAPAQQAPAQQAPAQRVPAQQPPAQQEWPALGQQPAAQQPAYSPPPQQQYAAPPQQAPPQQPPPQHHYTAPTQHASPRQTPPQQAPYQPPPQHTSPAYAQPTPAATPAVPTRISTLSLKYNSPPSEHNNHPIDVVSYLPGIPELDMGDGHAGWLVSGSRGMFNLWACSPVSPGMEPLQVMHAQGFDHICTDMVADVELRLLFSTGRDLRTGAEALLVRCLALEPGLLAHVHAFAPTPPPNFAPLAPGEPGMQAVETLSPMGGALRACAAASYSNVVGVYQMDSGGASATRCLKAQWIAHSAPIGALVRAPSGLTFLSGAKDGSIHLWDMREKPSAPQMALAHGAAVTRLAVLPNCVNVVSGGRDGVARLFDIRTQRETVAATGPLDGGAVSALAPSPMGDSVAIGTDAGGVHRMETGNTGGTGQVAQCGGGLGCAVRSLTWNSITCELYVASDAGAVSVFK